MAVQVSGDPDPANNGLFHIYADHLGSSGSLSDSSGVYIPNSHAKYTPFGDWRTEPSATAGDRYYTGHKHNNLGGGADDLGLIYMNARYYLPGVGRFASADTIVPNAANPQSYNRYSYAYNNPIKLFDPTGHVVEDAHNGSSCNERNGDICDPSADYGTTYPPGHEKEGEWIPRPIEPDPVAKIIITVVSFVPGIGEVIDVVDITLAVKNGNYDEAAIIAALAALPGASRAYREGGSVALRGIRGIGDEAAGPLRRTVNSALDCLFNSFTADMLVMTSRGLVPIGDIEEGEYVYAYDEIDDVFNYHPVTKVWAHTGSEIVNISIEGETITATLGHPFYSQDGWVMAGELSVGSQLFQADGSWGIVEQLNYGSTDESVYNLTVQEAHTFFVGKGEWLVHNCTSTPQSIRKSIRSLENLITEHESKLAAYIANPDAFDNRGFLANAPSEEVRQRIIQGRINHLQNEINTWQRRVSELQTMLND